ncbi:MAG: aminotransferase class I/II [OM182 bacterium MED-G24]|uniref:Aminotransferase n=1 Tax=OM182 bacterium MED-G24 TaxID=1986255 RepID=A0A2A5WMM3_9GAMM|nr:MAG: aminotransferase class I/II [OM182 bacterium MED-G24]
MTNVQIDHNIAGLKPSATLAMHQRANAMRARGDLISHFGFGQSPFPVPGKIAEALAANVHESAYLPTSGLPSLREAVAGFYRTQHSYDFASNNILIGPGSKDLIFHALYLIEGDLLLPTPCWVSYAPQARIHGKRVIPVETRAAEGYRARAEDIERAVISRGLEGNQKILVLSSPNNPTGVCLSKDELEDIAAVCRKYQVIVISDEIYAQINFINEPYASLAHSYPEGTIVTGGISKVFSAGGYRLGVMLIPESLSKLVPSFLAMMGETFGTVSTPVQHAAAVAYQFDESIASSVRMATQIHRFTGRYLSKRFNDMGLSCQQPEGAFYLFPDWEPVREGLLRRNIATGSELTAYIFDRASVALLPGSDFMMPDDCLAVRVASVDYNGARVMEAFPSEENMTDELTASLFPFLVSGCDRLADLIAEIS